ncbi:hypothetical protein D3C85_1278350 [compost metagenome]
MNERGGVLARACPTVARPFGVLASLRTSLSRKVKLANRLHCSVSLPVAASSMPCTRRSPASAVEPSAMVTRALVFSTWKMAASRPRRRSSSSHLVPSSQVRFFSGPSFCVASLRPEPEVARFSAEGLKELP